MKSVFVILVAVIMAATAAPPTHRLRSKSAPPSAAAAPPSASAASDKAKFVAAALGEEKWQLEVGFLSEGARTKHVHYTHGRSSDPSHVSPDGMTREDFYKHMAKVHAEAYPSSTSPTGSILVFGVVAQERYKDKPPGLSDTHKHTPCFTTTPHYWNKVSRISREKFKVPLNAVAHRTYAAMFAYVRSPTRCPSPNAPVKARF